MDEASDRGLAHASDAARAEHQSTADDQENTHDHRWPPSREAPAPDIWYYADQRGRVGPLSLAELKSTLATLPNASDELVWAEHLSEWKRARDVPELLVYLPESAQTERATDQVEPEARPPPPQMVAPTPEPGSQVQAVPFLPPASEHRFAAPSAAAEDSSPTTEGRRPQWRWLSKIKTREDALKAIKDISIAFFAIAALQAVLGIFVIGADVFIDVALYVGLAVWLRYGKSRIAALSLLVVASVSMAMTIAAQLNLTAGGRNVILAGTVLFAAWKAVEATFKLHGRFKTELNPTTDEPVEGIVELSRKRHNYFARHWRGELSLPVTYWVNGVLISLFAACAAVLLSYLEIHNQVRLATALFSVLGVYLVSGILIIWQSVGIWRSACRYKKTKKFWGGLAQFFVVVSVVVALASLAKNASEIATSINLPLADKRAGMQALRPGDVATNVRSGVDERGNHYLSLDGPIVEGDPERFAQAIFEANNRGYRLDALRLDSRGGPIWEAMVLAVMVRWVENMATVVERDAKCESACFGIFAAGYRKYVDPVSNPTQIGVHSVYAIIQRQIGAPILFWEEKEETTIWAVRRLKALGVPETIIGKIVTTPPDHMTYLTIEDLSQMGVVLTGYLGPSSAGSPAPVVDTIYLSPAIARANISLDNGTTIPGGTVVLTISDLTSNPIAYSDASICFSPATQDRASGEAARMCDISYHLPGGDISTARVRETSLILIQQGWNSALAPSARDQQPQQPTQSEVQKPPPEPVDHPIPTPGRYFTVGDVAFLTGPGAQYAPVGHGRLPSQTAVQWHGVCQEIADAQAQLVARWCRVTHGGLTGWVPAYYLRDGGGWRLSCIISPPTPSCMTNARVQLE